jgi:CTP synthase
MGTKYVFVTGGVVSSLGKGITAASLGRLLKCRGHKVSIQKFDPYINVDPGTMSPYQHGEVFVTEDGAETDLDLGHYERFIDENLSQDNNITTGKIYWTVINKERRGDFLGGTIQVIPHITEEIKRNIVAVGKGESHPEIVITEIGGTVGDIESLPFLEAIRQIRWEVGPENCVYVHVTLMPYLSMSGELKTKPTQHSVKELRSIGIQPDIIVCRSEMPIGADLKRKISLFCNVAPNCVIENLDASTIYEVPLMLEEEGLAERVCQKMGLEHREPDLAEWKAMVEMKKRPSQKVRIGIVGKYVELHDAYLSVSESLTHGGIHNEACIEIDWIQSEEITEETAPRRLAGLDGIVVPGGFGDRGIEGKIATAKYARENGIPYFGLCLGLQVAIIEYSRNVLGLKDANSTEFSPMTTHPVIDLMEDQRKIDTKGGTMRLGHYECKLKDGTLARSAYGAEVISERHRHRFELNNNFRQALEDGGLVMSGLNEELDLVEIAELPGHPWYLGVQFHPEFKSRPNRPHPLFHDFVKAALEHQGNQLKIKL